MEIKKDYSILFNAISDVIKELEELLKKGEDCLQLLKNAQNTTEEMYMNEDELET